MALCATRLKVKCTYPVHLARVFGSHTASGLKMVLAAWLTEEDCVRPH